MSGIQQIQWCCNVLESGSTKLKPLKWEHVQDHPLKPFIVTLAESRVPRKNVVNNITVSDLLVPLSLDGQDPLSQFSKGNEQLDPLSKIVMEENSWNMDFHIRNSDKYGKQVCSEVEPWSTRRTAILSKYTTSEKLSIVSSFLPGGEKLNIKSQAVVADKVKNRLEQLDDFDEGTVRQMLDLSQQQYILRIEQLNQELIQAWHGDQRVRALKIAIQCSKLLADTSVIQFYPSKFVIITDILDIFGKLVYERLLSKSVYSPSGSKKEIPLSETFTPEMVPESAKETCRNWFYKIASIRELLPRLYLEMAILKSYKFLSTSQVSLALGRLTRMVRGIGNPLVAVYARCYLCRVGISIPTTSEDFLKENFFEILSVYDEVFSSRTIQEVSEQNIDLASYFNLYTPPLDWILQNVASRASEAMLDDILDKCIQKQNSGLLLNNILSSFKAEYIANRGMLFVNLISKCNDQSFPQYLLLCSLGNCLTLASPPADELLNILNNVWNIVSNLSDPAQYITSAEIWVKYAVIHFGGRDINKLLGDIIRHMTPNKAFENLYPQLQTAIDRLITYSPDLEALITLDNFMPLVDLLQKDSVRVEICKNIMISHQNRIDASTNDPVIINALMFICKIMHDSVSALTVEDEIRQISSLISSFIKSVRYGRDFEQQLTFYVEARGSFTNLDSLNIQLIHSVNALSTETCKVVRGNHTRKTAAFVRACAAFCYITIPSITSVSVKLDLYLHSGQVALQNQCLGQADACFKAALNLIPELPKVVEIDSKKKSTESYLVSYMSNFASTLLIVPDSPDQGVLYLTRNLLNVLQSYDFDQQSSASVHVHLHILDMLAAAAQPSYTYHINKVDSNDVLYGSDPKFISEVNKLCSNIVMKILEHLVFLGDKNMVTQQSQIALELFQRIVMHGDLSQSDLLNLAYKLWNLAQKNTDSNIKKVSNRIIKYLEIKTTKTSNRFLMVLISKLQQKD